MAIDVVAENMELPSTAGDGAIKDAEALARIMTSCSTVKGSDSFAVRPSVTPKNSSIYAVSSCTRQSVSLRTSKRTRQVLPVLRAARLPGAV